MPLKLKRCTLYKSKKEGKDQESIQSITTPDETVTSQLDITNESQEVNLSQQLTTRHQQTDVHESITKQDRNNINDPQKKHRPERSVKIFYLRA